MSGDVMEWRGRIEEFVAEFTGDAELQEEGREHVRDARFRGADEHPKTMADALSDQARSDAVEVDTTPMVRDRAYDLWQRAGRPYGREYEFWFQASREIEGDIEAQKLESKAHRSVAR